MRAMKRIEEDLLGAREVPLEVYWGIHTLRAIENYQISVRQSLRNLNLSVAWLPTLS